MRQHLLFDLDDTLIYCNRYFNHVIDQFASFICSWFQPYLPLSLAEVKQKQLDVDTALISESGFKSVHFPQSFIIVYEYYCQQAGISPQSDRKDQLWELGISVYHHETEPYPHMENTLEQLADEGHILHLYTGGEPKIQLRKINELQLERFFENRIYIRQLKNTAALTGILQDHHFDRNATWMVGNSIRNDIVPALSNGIHAIHMITPDEWSFNIVNIEVEPQGAFYSLDSLHLIPNTISTYYSK